MCEVRTIKGTYYIIVSVIKKTKKSPFRRSPGKAGKRKLKLVALCMCAVTGVAVLGGFFLLTHRLSPQLTASPTSTKTTKKINKVDLTLTQYSDNHITYNAVASDPRFNTLALADFERAYTGETNESSQLARVSGAVWSGNTKEYGTWLWTPTMEITPTYIDTILSGAKARGVNVLYVSIDSYLDIYKLPDGPDKDQKKKEFTAKLEDIVRRAHDKGIAVDAEGGWRNWAERTDIYKAFAVVNYVREFNDTQTYTLRGFQYDVEPYLLDLYKKDPALVLTHFLDLVDQTVTLLKGSAMTLSVVVPDFYDAGSGLSPHFTYAGIDSYAYNHLLDILQNRPHSEVIVMSYRNFATGDDGAIDITSGEIQTAQSGVYSTKVIVAQETGEVLPPYITYNKTTRNYLSQQISDIRKAFGTSPNFGGIAIHYVNSYLVLK